MKIKNKQYNILIKQFQLECFTIINLHEYLFVVILTNLS